MTALIFDQETMNLLAEVTDAETVEDLGRYCDAPDAGFIDAADAVALLPELAGVTGELLISLCDVDS